MIVDSVRLIAADSSPMGRPPGALAGRAPLATRRRGPQRIRILVVDDTAAVHADFRRILGASQLHNDELDELSRDLFGDAPPAPERRYEYGVDAANQGEAGLDLLVEAHRAGPPYDVAFVDMRMPPGWNGVETTGRLWRVERHLQVVLCTAYSDFRWDHVIAELGTSENLHLLRKPFSADHVRSMAEVLGVKAQRLRG